MKDCLVVTILIVNFLLCSNISGTDALPAACDGWMRATCHYQCALQLKACNSQTCTCYDPIGNSPVDGDLDKCDGWRRATCHYQCALELKACDSHTCKCYDNNNIGSNTYSGSKNDLGSATTGCDGVRRVTCHYQCALELKACDSNTCKCYDNYQENEIK